MMYRRIASSLAPLVLLMLNVVAVPAADEGGVFYRDLAADSRSGLDYHRVASASESIWSDFKSRPVMRFEDAPFTPFKWHGAPGVALIDHDRDGDLDLYVTNGPGAANSLFVNQLAETGVATFVDLAAHAGVSATDQDSSGVCFGDTDNDGDPDLLVLSNFGTNRFFLNNGDGTFSDRTVRSGLDRDPRSAMSCSFGDVDGDGLLDVAIANSWQDMANSFGLLDPFGFNQHNQLFLNTGGNVFVDGSFEAGIEATRGLGSADGSPTLTWAVALVDYDLDGDVDLLQADDQAGVPLTRDGGIDRGFIQVFNNDGSGHFTNVTVEANMRHHGEWMGLSFGDLNADGHLDVFGANGGDWAFTMVSAADPYFTNFFPWFLGRSTSRWFLGSADGTFTDPGVGDLVATPFAWGTVMTDYDNDGDTDIAFYGSLVCGPKATADNPGAVLQNDGFGNFTYDDLALQRGADHRARAVQGVATGDVNGDGFGDFVTVSGLDMPDDMPFAPLNTFVGSPFDGGFFYTVFGPENPAEPFQWPNIGSPDFIDGTLAVEVSETVNANGWIKVRLSGSSDVLDAARSNRDGIGAVITVRTDDGRQTMRPVTGGSSYASQDSLELTFGLGGASAATISVLWPGGTTNRLLDARPGERIEFPEIPCDFASRDEDRGAYARCVSHSMHELVRAGRLERQEASRFTRSAFKP